MKIRTLSLKPTQQMLYEHSYVPSLKFSKLLCCIVELLSHSTIIFDTSSKFDKFPYRVSLVRSQKRKA